MQTGQDFCWTLHEKLCDKELPMSNTLQSRSVTFDQFNLQGTLHWDYLDDVEKKVPDERPQSIIIALDPFNLLYEYDSDYHDGSVGCKSVAKGEAVMFTSSLRHAGGSNGTKDYKTWKYRLFVYIVSEQSDFPSEVTRLNLN